MRKTMITLMLGVAVAVTASMSTIKWKTTNIDLGEVTRGETINLEFEFTNYRAVPVKILESKGSCGCTNVQHPEGEIQPGETASISAKFRSGQLGAFRKNVRVRTSDSDEYTYLYFKGEVVQ